jgi:hypothetical protein
MPHLRFERCRCVPTSPECGCRPPHPVANRCPNSVLPRVNSNRGATQSPSCLKPMPISHHEFMTPLQPLAGPSMQPTMGQLPLFNHGRTATFDPIFKQYEMCISVEESRFLERQGNHLLTTTPHITLPSSNRKYPLLLLIKPRPFEAPTGVA